MNAKKADLKNETGVDTYHLANTKKIDSANSKSDVDKLDIDIIKIYQLI